MTADTDQLLDQAAAGDERAVAQLLAKYRVRLCDMVRLRMDNRMAWRYDPSDVVQEALLDAYRQLPRYLVERPLPFYPWLRQITWQHLVAHHRRHLKYQIRNVPREDEVQRSLPGRSRHHLVEQLMDSLAVPSQQAAHSELRRDIFAALKRLSDGDREVLVLRVLEQLSARETAAVLGVTEGAVRVRQLQALTHLKEMVDGGR